MADISSHYQLSLILVQRWPGRVHLPVPHSRQPLELLPKKVGVSPEGGLKGQLAAKLGSSQDAEEGGHLWVLVVGAHGNEGRGGTGEPVQEGGQGSGAGTRGKVQEEAGKVGGGQGDVVLTGGWVGDIVVREDKRAGPAEGHMGPAEHVATLLIKPGKIEMKKRASFL